MAIKAAARRARETSASLVRELRKLAAVLDARRLCPDVSPLQTGIAEWSDRVSRGWRYNIDNLLFHRVPSDKCFPANILELTCRFSADVRGYYEPEPLSDPLQTVSVEITLEALSIKGERLIHGWHFDRHVGDPSKKPGDTEAAHPRYHFHFGGNRMRAFARENNLSSFPHLLLFDGPRPAHPPLDAILAIDFLLSNFFAAEWRALRNNAEYNSVLSSAQRRLWKPYADVLPNHWAAANAVDRENQWQPEDCWPNLVGVR